MSFTAPTIPLDIYGEANIRLGQIEAREEVTILFAVESGSRAWGFPSPDSDYDVRFFYVRPLPTYLGIDDPRDVIERPIDGLWDVNGWDLRKAIKLLVKGNATVAEWLSSPLIYRESGPFAAKLRTLIKRHATPQASARHYFGLTQKCYAGEIGNRPTAVEMENYRQSGMVVKGLTNVNLKKYLYALRGSIAISWIREFNEVPPMTMPHLLSQDIIPADLRAEVDKLLRRKMSVGEIGFGERIAVMDEFIETQMAWVKSEGMDRMPLDKTFATEAEALLLNALGIA